MIIGITVGDRAQTTDPVMSRASRMTAIRRLPYMSPSLPDTGVQMAEMPAKARTATTAPGRAMWVSDSREDILSP
jgi:hypothetical protein